MTEEHKGLPVAGYQPQTDYRIALVNRNKALEERVLRVLDELKESEPVDQRWLAIGRTAIENGFMAVNRAIFQPARVELPDDNVTVEAGVKAEASVETKVHRTSS